MIRSILMGVVAGMRSITPLAVVSWAARRQPQSSQPTALSMLSLPAVSKVTLALAAAELLGDKMRSAPDRIITPGILARVATGAIAGAAVAPSRDRTLWGGCWARRWPWARPMSPWRCESEPFVTGGKPLRV